MSPVQGKKENNLQKYTKRGWYRHSPCSPPSSLTYPSLSRADCDQYPCRLGRCRG